MVNTRYAEKCLKTLEINNAPTAIPRYTIPPRKPFVLFCKYEEKRKKIIWKRSVYLVGLVLKKRCDRERERDRQKERNETNHKK